AVDRAASDDRPTTPAATNPSPASHFTIVLGRSLRAVSSPFPASTLAGDVELKRNSQNPVFSLSVKGVPDPASGRSFPTQRQDVRCTNLVNKQHLRPTQQPDLWPSSGAILPTASPTEPSVSPAKLDPC